MIEVFKTDAKGFEQAENLLDAIRGSFINYRVNFDLQDCDKILRVESASGYIESTSIINFLQEHGCKAQILEDIVRPKVRDIEYAKSLSQVF